MDIDQFLEKNMITFLESKVERKEKINIDREEEYGIYLTRDYEKELEEALSKDELTQAKRLFDELKEVYNSHTDSFEKKKIYYILEEMYAALKKYGTDKSVTELNTDRTEKTEEKARERIQESPEERMYSYLKKKPFMKKIIVAKPKAALAAKKQREEKVREREERKKEYEEQRKVTEEEKEKPIKSALSHIHIFKTTPQMMLKKSVESVEEAAPPSPSPRERHHEMGGGKELIKKLYEGGVYKMFQKEYREASTVFERIIQLKPNNRAAKIRLYECHEAIENA